MDSRRIGLHWGHALKLIAWTEEKESRSMVTGNGVLVTHKGDTAVVFVVERWTKDIDAALETLRQLLKGGTP